MSIKEYDYRLAMEAAKKIDDQSLCQNLYETISINCDWNSKEIALEAISLLNEQKLLINVLYNAKCYDVQVNAVNKITDQNILADIAKSKKWDYLRKAAVEKLTDQSVLAEIAKTDNIIAVKIAAIKNFDTKNLQLIPEIVENIISNSANYKNEEVKDFIQFAYKASQQSQKQILQKYDGKIFPHIDLGHSDNNVYADYYGDGGYSHSDNHTDNSKATICF